MRAKSLEQGSVELVVWSFRCLVVTVSLAHPRTLQSRSFISTPLGSILVPRIARRASSMAPTKLPSQERSNDLAK